MQSTHLFPVAQTREGQVQGFQGSQPSVVQTYSPSVHQVHQVHQVSQQVFSTPPSPSYKPFPTVAKSTPQPVFTPVQTSFPVVQPWAPPINHQVQAMMPQVMGQDSKPLFPAAKDRK
jgi:hypothetical protein